jgi:hypothetical protein
LIAPKEFVNVLIPALWQGQMAKNTFEKQAESLIRGIATGNQLVRRSKILVEDLDTMTILSIESRGRRAGRRQSLTKALK